MKKCEKCDIEMTIVEHGDPKIGDMGISVRTSHYRCPTCNRWDYCPDAAANFLAQTIDKSILDKLLKNYNL